MALERRSPLPVGRYWVTAFGDHEAVLAAYLNTQVVAGLVKVTVTEHIDETSDHPGGSFFVFIVGKPDAVPWNATLFGYPNLAGKDIKSLADTVDRPDLPTDGLDDLGDFVKKAAAAVGGVVEVVVGVVVVGGGLYLLSKLFGRRG